MRNEHYFESAKFHRWHEGMGAEIEESTIRVNRHVRKRRGFDAYGRRNEVRSRHGGPRGGRGGGFGPRGTRRANRGDVRLAILSLLSEGASNRYGLIKMIAEMTGNASSPRPRSVYPTLQQLVDEGLTSPLGDGRRTEYELTELGRQYGPEHDEHR